MPTALYRFILAIALLLPMAAHAGELHRAGLLDAQETQTMLDALENTTRVAPKS